ncbi:MULTISPECIES: FAD-dependent oxidoreductase [Leptospirillum]|jgi:NADPH-dependent glutamate synthase beta subunit-like oxidoreductase|uniref:Pyridine nucleotide-disulfide oxidoreductase n=1 Tax=Leptospirillum ferriphilum TaxID=178606 RepID=A0A1V3SWN0_9BACT|nr:MULTISPECIES: FAD-dependent oxidoreductase [Leptospirillum]EAY56756.1 MAG: Pyridine nucleotide-disulphide oxidoreductase [Leptospirillum rubarum]EIJ76680.1 MAG: FAD-dependent pyridine nucleotide-disulfide oxidoreductase [Leptospirillum sp. Group II 'C75']MCL4405783.1 FAD-dependent oxidoreductase [Bacillota bacterium]AKS24030.1 pyridine nucleotide-disulfide oxidoreductase [Leptospirillum sp. Group II 'CF-1']OOH73667.1 pyridine nucleotide-disulfide oxidoreductase [Leptospirillum ferriphilum]
MKGKYKLHIPEYQYYADQVACRKGCPVGTDAGGYVQAIRSGLYEKAYAIARGPNPFASVCGWVCNAPCEASCTRGNIDSPVTIRALKRFVTEKFGVEAVMDPASTLRYSTAPGVPYGRATGEKVAIIGGGPAGLTAAHDLARLGYRITMFEANKRLGGLFYLVPEYRLPRPLIQAEVDAIASMGFDIRLGTKVGKDVSFKEIQEEFKSVVVAVGAWGSRPVPFEGKELEHVYSALPFLQSVYLDHSPVPVGRRVAVVGAGNVAMDVCRTAVRLPGVEKVSVIALEDWNEMPADDMEIEDAVAEGVEFLVRKGTRRVVGEGKVQGLEVVRVLSVFDDQGRFSPTYDETEKSVVPFDSVVFAIGQTIDSSFIPSEHDSVIGRNGVIRANIHSMETGIPGVFAAGDVVTGPRIFIDAIAGGQKAAASVHRYLTGKSEEVKVYAVSTPVDHRGNPTPIWPVDFNVDGYYGISRANPSLLTPEFRKTNFELAELSFSEEEAREQASRCLTCHVNPIFEGEKCIMCGGCVDVCPEYALKMIPLSDVDLDQESTAKVVESFLGVELSKREEVGVDQNLDHSTAMIWEGSRCIRCGLCAKRCPTGAISMEFLEIKQEVALP